MSKIVPNVSLPAGMPRKTKFQSNDDVISSRTFFEFCPDYYHYVVPHETVKIKLNAFGRLYPLVSPTYGRMNVKYRAFFVPFSSVFAGFNDFISDTTHVFASGTTSGQLTRCRVVSMDTLEQWLISGCTEVQSGYDFEYKDSQNVSKFYKFGMNGNVDTRSLYKMLLALGYQFPFNYQESRSLTVSALPILAAARIYLDWYYPTQFRDEIGYNAAMHTILVDQPTTNPLSVTELNTLFVDSNFTCYPSDYFTAAFKRPNMPNNSSPSVLITDVNQPNDYGLSQGGAQVVANQSGANNNSVNAPLVTGMSGNSHHMSLSQYILDVLQRLSSYYKRNQLAGSYAYERMLARFGLRVQNNYSKFIGEYELPIYVQDVTSTADTTTAVLGEQAGKGVAADGKNGFFEYQNADEYGIVIVVATLIPKSGYYQGIDRHLLDVNRFDFYTPEFDGVGTQAISAAELFVSKNPAFNSNLFDQVFGHTQRYAHYKVGHDAIIGDFRLGRFSGMHYDSWHLMRDFEGLFSQASDVVNSAGLVFGMDYEQYMRLFGTIPEKADIKFDPLILISHYDVEWFAPMRSLFDDVVFDQLQHDSTGKLTTPVASAKLT